MVYSKRKTYDVCKGETISSFLFLQTWGLVGEYISKPFKLLWKDRTDFESSNLSS